MRCLIAPSIFVSLVFLGCTPTDPTGDPLPANGSDGTLPAKGDGTSTAPSSSSSSDGACVSLAGADPSTLPACTGTKGTSGRCLPSTELGSFSDTFEQASCASGQSCVPEELVKEGSTIQLKKCTAVLNSEGRCFWPLAKDILANYDILKGATMDQCDPDMVCAPCVNPLTMQSTGVCDLGASCTPSGGSATPPAGGGASATCPQKDPIVDVSGFSQEDCANAGLLCVPTALVPGDLAKELATCKSGVCAPKKSVERGGNYVPPTCRSLADAEGRCTNVGIPSVAAMASELPTAGCDVNEACAPCFDPRDGKATGACSTAPCDAPKEPAKSFASCCGGEGRCVPTASVDASTQDLLTSTGCKAGAELCAPTQLVPIPGTPMQRCSIFGFVDGICISQCTVSSFGLGDLVQGDCASSDMCAPCDLLPNGSCN